MGVCVCVYVWLCVYMDYVWVDMGGLVDERRERRRVERERGVDP
jgi:hypothetical protein